MSEAISLKLDDRELRRNLRKLSDREIPRWAAATVNKCAFEVLDAEKAHAKDVFKFSGGQTELFLSGRGAFRFDKATARNPQAVIYPNPHGKGGERRLAIFETQERGGLFRAGEPGRFEIEGKVAVPVLKSRGVSPAGFRARRTARGYLRRISKHEAGSFRVGNVIMERERREQWAAGSSRAGSRAGTRLRKPRLRILFALVPEIRISPIFEFYRVARDTARAKVAEKAKREFERIRVHTTH